MRDIIFIYLNRYDMNIDISDFGKYYENQEKTTLCKMCNIL